MPSNRAGDDSAAWLAAATGRDPTDVAAELDEGARRRVFVVDELLDAGYRDGELLELVERLTGLDDGQARALIADRERFADQPRERAPLRDQRLAENEILF